MSARSVIDQLDRSRYEVVPMAITREGQWLPPAHAQKALSAGRAEATSEETALAVRPGSEVAVVGLSEGIDIVFPVLHGPYGEDGTIQGLLEMAGLPYVGCGVLGSAVGMDKALMKAVWQSAGLPVMAAEVVLRAQWENHRETILDRMMESVGVPCFVKPCNLGSSVGISKARDRQSLGQALDLACRFDRKILVEKAVQNPREIELAVLGNDTPEVSVPGEIIHGQDFYDYETKYFATEGQKTIIPAELSPETAKNLQDLAVKAFLALDLSGLSRVDFLLDAEGTAVLNEVNTLPGFTPISMYSQLWAASGLPYPKLLDRLIELGFERFADRERNQSNPALTTS